MGVTRIPQSGGAHKIKNQRDTPSNPTLRANREEPAGFQLEAEGRNPERSRRGRRGDEPPVLQNFT